MSSRLWEILRRHFFCKKTIFSPKGLFQGRLDNIQYQMHYFIDGYNLMFRLGMTGDSLRSERERFIRNFYEKIQAVGLDVTLVFDAQNQSGLGTRTHIDFLEICFTDHGETADDYIINELGSTPNPRNEIIVTSDKNLSKRARELYAKSEAVEEFMKWLDHSFKKKKKQKPLTPSSVKQPKALIPEEILDPILDASVEKNLNEYLDIFEKKSQELTPPNKQRSSKIKNDQSKENDMERWKRIFEAKINESGN